MWPFSKLKGCRGNWLSHDQTRAALKIYFADVDEGCWFAAVFFTEEDIFRLAASSREEAMAVAQDLSDEVFTKSGRRLPIREGR